jgi:hypothetical protein
MRALSVANGYAMNSVSESDVDQPARKHRARFELIFASIWLAVGFFVMPALVYVVGTLLLGPYGLTEVNGGGLGSFYGDFFSDLVEPAGRVWMLALGPLVVISVLRLLFLNFSSKETRDENPETHERPAALEREPPRRARERVEPRVTGD